VRLWIDDELVIDQWQDQTDNIFIFFNTASSEGSGACILGTNRLLPEIHNKEFIYHSHGHAAAFPFSSLLPGPPDSQA
ncbi:MAG TPA: hypothetical protein PLO24_08655, partial [Bacteroidales bacterium]|nr:hypothetical protein [Bacteroidales bacterium]